jgi:peptidyl-prolyl cis-trans isomerase SurA
MIPSMKLRRRGAAQAASVLAFAAVLAQATVPVAVSAQTAAPGVAATPAPAPTAPDVSTVAPTPTPGLSEGVAAIVNDEIVSTYDLAQRMRLLILTSGIQVNEQNLPQLQQQALISLVDEHLQIQELKRVEKEQKFDIVPTEDEVNEELADMAKSNNMSSEQFIAMFKARGVQISTLKSQIRSELGWQRWIRGRYGSRVIIGPDQIKATEQRLAMEASKPQYQISEVFIEASRVGSMEVALQGAGQLLSQLQQGAPFAAVARQFSASPTAASGGDAGWVTATDLPPEVTPVLDGMRPGQLSRPIQVSDGVYLIYLRDKRSGAGTPVVALKQAAVALPRDATPQAVAAATAKLESIRPNVTGCDNLEAAAGKVQGVMAGDLGEAEVKDLSPAFRSAAETLQVGQLSQPIRTEAGLHLIAVCGRKQGGAQALTAEQIENRLTGQQLAMISKRYMRDLRNSATIETR